MSRLLEHHTLELMAARAVAVPGFRVVDRAPAAGEAARALGGPVVLKALIPVGGRGKAGGIRRADTPEQAAAVAEDLLGREVLRFPVERLLVSAPVEIGRELFVAITFDSVSRRPLLLFSALGGIEVEAILERDPNRLIQRRVSITRGLQPFAAREVAAAAGLRGRTLIEVGEVLVKLWRVFAELDAQTVEVNPLALTPAGQVVAPSGVIVVDDQAAFRHPELAGIADPGLTNGWRPFTPLEREMRAIDATDPGSAIRFNELDGDIAFMVTGGGAGLLAFDAILAAGGRPATTFDITPGRVEDKMYLATKAILARSGLKGLIAGGNISNFIPIDVKVRGVVRALKEFGVDPQAFPVVFRFDGPNAEAAKALAAELPGIDYLDRGASIEDAVQRILARTRAQ